ncbi:hypothetical protein BDK88_3651 [Natrinema hispanicum]|uniref:Uncharacterized protein n=1 Tax=Natrinema hispanicum TaxID=392421 RepID=A0A482Y338_9EURY|nr:hypothetical protein BDK88_3651 [Natrinema hispanicum]
MEQHRVTSSPIPIGILQRCLSLFLDDDRIVIGRALPDLFNFDVVLPTVTEVNSRTLNL